MIMSETHKTSCKAQGDSFLYCNTQSNPASVTTLPAGSASFYKDDPFSYANIVAAAKYCCGHGSGWKSSVMRWKMNLFGNCLKLHHELHNGTYKMKKVNTFFIMSPKKRRVSALQLADRIVHKIICHQGGLVEDAFRNAFYDNTACQKNKGTDFARARLIKHLRRHYRKYGCQGYWLNLDIHQFFASIPHDRLIQFVMRKVRNPLIRKMVVDIIKSNNMDVGLDLGSEVSQVLANAYLTPVDYVIKQRLGMEGYVRYADNLMVLVPPHSNDPTGKLRAQALFKEITYALGTVGLSMNPKSAMTDIRQAGCFLGFSFRLTGKGNIVTKLCKKAYNRAKRHFQHLSHKWTQGRLLKTALIESYRAWYSHACKATEHRRAFTFIAGI